MYCFFIQTFLRFDFPQYSPTMSVPFRNNDNNNDILLVSEMNVVSPLSPCNTIVESCITEVHEQVDCIDTQASRRTAEKKTVGTKTFPLRLTGLKRGAQHVDTDNGQATNDLVSNQVQLLMILSISFVNLIQVSQLMKLVPYCMTTSKQFGY